jgi:hypothetical protein
LPSVFPQKPFHYYCSFCIGLSLSGPFVRALVWLRLFLALDHGRRSLQCPRCRSTELSLVQSRVSWICTSLLRFPAHADSRRTSNLAAHAEPDMVDRGDCGVHGPRWIAAGRNHIGTHALAVQINRCPLIFRIDLSTQSVKSSMLTSVAKESRRQGIEWIRPRNLRWKES